MAFLISIFKILHISAGSLALISGLISILFRRKIRYHRPFGKLYFLCMTIIFITALVMASVNFNLFLLFIGIFTYHSSLTALRSLKLKTLHLGQKPMKQDWIIEICNCLANAGLLSLGIYSAIEGRLQEGIVAIAFSVIGLRNSQQNIRRLKGRVTDNSYWLTAHIAGMLGSYIGAITAFTVNNNRWLGLPDAVAWLGPSLVLVPFIIYETSRISKKVIITA